MRIRSATVDDADMLAVVQTRTSQQAYRGVMPDHHLARLDPARRSRVWRQLIESDVFPAGTLVLEHESDGVAGFINVAAHPDGVGEVRAVYVLPEHWGSGAGRLLMAAGLQRLADAGYREVVLWVLEANERARRFYQAGGWFADGATKTDDSRGTPLVAVRYRYRQP
ncbi:putative GCN5-related N-acetyltransferase [Actinoplanes missouriensis 431]|uniref:Putative GCN5-related N-acetyltransferase n=1 Tax=Actinoplanes missouriensis (strain ATCC 14538 / DSM 43046 / CBS 188.64 / JCM 3121 / NBRC 102363 / NCIMB 12654 / NRRL B-3342 / UNCC 431) TaxID=512565 RepID=I0H435_ACTM4|nr:GNAT family N-acetyltransferase [Actinoplanes missouriensis]BAL87772.1 putative GCN5-related N-acetyltransferase [Actinoplanes missouriensis 431]